MRDSTAVGKACSNSRDSSHTRESREETTAVRIHQQQARTDGNTINRRDTAGTPATPGTLTTAEMWKIRDPDTLETPIAEGTSTAVGMAATAGILATAGTPETSIVVRTTAAAGTPETSETMTTAEALGMRPKQRQSQQQQQMQQEHLA
jgi:hypothetical protein